MLSAFPSMVSELKGGETVLTGLLSDRSALFGVIWQIEALGLDLLELQQIPPGADAGRLALNHPHQARTAHLNLGHSAARDRQREDGR